MKQSLMRPLLLTRIQATIEIVTTQFDRQINREVPSVKNKLTLIALSIIASAPAFASQQSTSQGFIDDSHLDLFLRNAYIKRDYRDGLPDKAEWGQGIIATFASGFTQGPVGFGVDGIAQYAVRLDGGRGRGGGG